MWVTTHVQFISLFPYFVVQYMQYAVF